MIEKFRCSTKNCRGIPSVKYLGKWLCEECWNDKCEVDKNEKTKLL